MRMDVKAFQKPQLTIEDLRDVSPDVVRDNAAVTIDAGVETLPHDSPHPIKEIEPPRQPPALRNTDLRCITSKAVLVYALTQNLPLNDYNMPKYIYRPDLLDYSIFHTTPTTTYSVGQSESSTKDYGLMQEALDNATLFLDYHEGYPSLQGCPIWAKFPWESAEEFDLFNAYLALPGARTLAAINHLKREYLNELFHTNYWPLRCLASDTFAVVHYRRMREHRILSTDNKHFLEAEKILKQLVDIQADINWDVLKEDPKEYVQTMLRVAQLQRQALGISERRGADDNEAPSIEVIMRKATQHLTPPTADKTSGDIDIAAILRDPASVSEAQELILRVGAQKPIR